MRALTSNKRRYNVPTILCVDDQSAGLAIRKQLLETKGYEVLLASNGPEAIALTRKHRVDLIILDYRLPGMDGEEIAHILKTENPTRPIVLLTGYAGEIPQRLLSRVDGFVEKGNSASVLLSAVENAMRASKGRGSRSLRSTDKRHTA
jgi:CheY-like chemotaxis protein